MHVDGWHWLAGWMDGCMHGWMYAYASKNGRLTGGRFSISSKSLARSSLFEKLLLGQLERD